MDRIYRINKIKGTVVKVTHLSPKALSPRPRGRADEKTYPGDAPETGTYFVKGQFG